MAPLHAAINATLVSRTDQTAVYHADVDPEWSVIKVPQGGYVLGLVLEAVMQFQSKTSQPDPIHLTAHFLRPTSPGRCEIRIRVVKTGKGFTNLTATVVQNAQDIILAHLICGILQSDDPTKPVATTLDNLTVAPPSKYAVRIPMHTHPANCKPHPPLERWAYKKRIAAARDPVYDAQMRAARGVNGSDWGEYITLTGEDERLSLSMMPFLADSALPFPVLLPALRVNKTWVPTMVMTVEFKFPLPKTWDDHSQRTVAVYSRGKFVNDPSGRHDSYAEVWTAPTNVGEGVVADDWKDKQRCLAVATQMALIVPAEVNARRGVDAGKPAKL